MPDQGDDAHGTLAPTLKARERERGTGSETVGNGHFETLVCRGCGNTRWFARDVKPDPELEPIERQCRECDEHRFWRVHALRERSYLGLPIALPVVHLGHLGAGHYKLEICRGCGNTRWFAGIAEAELEGAAPLADGRLCGGCSSDRFFHVERVMEHGATGLTPLRLQLRDGVFFCKALGTFDVVFCRACKLVEWYAKGADRLREDPVHGISAVEATVGAQPVEGPYR